MKLLKPATFLGEIMKKLRYILFSILALFMTFVSPGANVFADEPADISVVYNSVTNNSQVFPNCDATCQKLYQYLVIRSNSPDYTSYDINVSIFTSTGRGNLTYVFNGSTILSIYKIDDGAQSVSTPLKFYNTRSLNRDVEFILTNTPDIPSSGSACPEPVIPSCDDPWIVRFFEGGFWNIATAVIALVVPILAIFLVFRLIHGLIFGKGV